MCNITTWNTYNATCNILCVLSCATGKTNGHKSFKVCLRCVVSPQAAGGVAQQQGGLELDLMVVAVRNAAPARVGDDDGVGQRAQRVANDGHLHCIT